MPIQGHPPSRLRALLALLSLATLLGGAACNPRPPGRDNLTWDSGSWDSSNWQ